MITEKNKDNVFYVISFGHHLLRPSKLKFHLDKVDSNYKEKRCELFKGKENSVKRQRLDSTGEFQHNSKSIVKSFYLVIFMIAKQCKPYANGEILIKPYASEMDRIVLGEESKIKLLQIPLSKDTVQWRIVDLSDNIKEQVIAEIKNLQFGLFSI